MNEIQPELSDGCPACRLLATAKGRRVYYEDADFIIFENLSTMTPILIGLTHGEVEIPFRAFKQLKEICGKLYGDCYSLNPEALATEHYYVRTVRLTSSTLKI